MVETIGVACSIVALATFVFQSSVSLYKNLPSFRSHPQCERDLLGKLEALSAVLAPLVELVQSNSDVNLSLLNLPRLRCGDFVKVFSRSSSTALHGRLITEQAFGTGPTNLSLILMQFETLLVSKVRVSC